MSEFTSLGKAISYTGTQIASLTNENAKELPSKDINKMTAELNKANNFLDSVKEKPVPKFDQKFIKNILKDIDKIKRNIQPAVENAKPEPKQKLINALTRFRGHLTDLKHKRDGKNNKDMTVVRIKSDVKIEGIKQKGAIQQHKDLNKHLSIVEKEISSLKGVFLKDKNRPLAKKTALEGEQKKVATSLKKTDAVLKKTDIVLLKEMARHKAHRQVFPPETQSMISKIQREITVLQNRMEKQNLAGALQVQANLFRTTLKEFKSRLYALKKLRRGRRVEAVELDPDKQERED